MVPLGTIGFVINLDQVFSDVIDDDVTLNDKETYFPPLMI